MANLRKRVAACDLERKRTTTTTPEPESLLNPDLIEIEQQPDNRPLIPKVSTM